jgi:hypothetical protein
VQSIKQLPEQAEWSIARSVDRQIPALLVRFTATGPLTLRLQFISSCPEQAE